MINTNISSSKWVNNYKTPDLMKDKTLEVHKLNNGKVKDFSLSIKSHNRIPSSKVSTSVINILN
jgi:hypothetical protein